MGRKNKKSINAQKKAETKVKTMWKLSKKAVSYVQSSKVDVA